MGLDWDTYFLDIANVVKTKSKDPSTQVGSVIVSRENTILATGFNGFPRGIDEKDTVRWDRPAKYEWIEHSERNSLYSAARLGVRLDGATLYLVGLGPPCLPCTNCAKGIIQSGILKVVGWGQKELPEKWKEDFVFSKAMLLEAGVEFHEHTRST